LASSITQLIRRRTNLNKFGQDKYFTINPQYGDYTYLDINFNKMIETCSHDNKNYILSGAVIPARLRPNFKMI